MRGGGSNPPVYSTSDAGGPNAGNGTGQDSGSNAGGSNAGTNKGTGNESAAPAGSGSGNEAVSVGNDNGERPVDQEVPVEPGDDQSNVPAHQDDENTEQPDLTLPDFGEGILLPEIPID